MTTITMHAAWTSYSSARNAFIRLPNDMGHEHPTFVARENAMVRAFDRVVRSSITTARDEFAALKFLAKDLDTVIAPAIVRRVLAYKRRAVDGDTSQVSTR